MDEKYGKNVSTNSYQRLSGKSYEWIQTFSYETLDICGFGGFQQVECGLFISYEMGSYVQ